MNPLIYAIITILLSGLLATVISFWLHHRFIILSTKRDVLRRFVGNRYILTSTQHMGRVGEPFVALNEIFVVYAKHPQVIAALKKMHEEIGAKDRLVDNILTLTKAMAKAAKVPVQELNDEFIARPFTPPRPETTRASPTVR